MKRVFVIGSLPNDRLAKKAVEELRFQGPVKLISQDISYTSSSKKHHLLDCCLVFFSETSSKDLVERVKEATDAPVVVVSEHKTLERFETPQRDIEIYYTCNLKVNIWSILSAILARSENPKVQLGEGEFIKLTANLKEPKIEKISGNEVVSAEQLTLREALVLKLLFQNPQEPVHYRDFYLLGIREDSLPVYISHLRKILGKIDPQLTIRSVRRKGYTLSYGL